MQLGLVQLQEENGKFTTFCWVKQACMMLACGRCNSVAWSLVMFPLGLFVKRQESGRQHSADVNESASFHRYMDRTDSYLDFLSSSVWSSCIASEFTWSCRRGVHTGPGKRAWPKLLLSLGYDGASRLTFDLVTMDCFLQGLVHCCPQGMGAKTWAIGHVSKFSKIFQSLVMCRAHQNSIILIFCVYYAKKPLALWSQFSLIISAGYCSSFSAAIDLKVEITGEGCCIGVNLQFKLMGVFFNIEKLHQAGLERCGHTPFLML